VELRLTVNRYFSRLERLAIGVEAKVYDFEILCLMAGRLLSAKYTQFENYIKIERVEKKTPRLYMEIELLVEKIDKYIESHPNRIVDGGIIIPEP